MNQIVDRLHTEQAREVFARNKVVLAYLFGSQARGRTWNLSDVDVAVMFSPQLSKRERFKLLLQLLVDLGEVLKRDDVQVIDVKEASPLLRHRIYYDGQILYCLDDTIRVQFELKAIRDYVDTIPLRRLKEKYISQRFLEGAD